MAPSSPEELRDTIISWFENYGSKGIRLSINEILGKDPEDPNNDYDTKYELELVPESINQATVFFIISREGYLGAGIENIKRYEERVGRKISGRVKSAFIFGHQPSSVSCIAVVSLLDVAAGGDFFLGLRYVPFLSFPTIGITAEASHRLIQNGYPHVEKFQIVTKETASDFLRYEPWK